MDISALDIYILPHNTNIINVEFYLANWDRSGCGCFFFFNNNNTMCGVLFLGI